MAERGRPTEYTAELAAEVCARLAEGRTLRSVCRDEDMPPESTVRQWAVDDREGFSAHYAKAREIGYQAMADETLEIADDATNDWMEQHASDDIGWKENGEAIARSRLRVDTRKWLLSKALPKMYGDKVAIGGADDLPPVKTETSDKELARQVAFMLAKGLAQDDGA